ncbi:response regulator [Devosia sp. ZB163]|uniref:response regulator n=1 Tax=Devosia sp. ZB163 TaxID=3025938 RepID=UPI002360C338|nr:response regulator [Devosia sp. ZB163]MDC9824274.1 response regulator [Devosia sp. ZB163]
MVLVVEDEPMIMLGAVQLFETAGFEALVAFSSDEAVAHLEGRGGIVVAFIEYDVPGTLDGPQLAETVRNRWPTVEIIVVSRPRIGHAPDLPLGARYFEKPYTHSEINRALEELGLTGELPRARTNLPPRG